MIAVQSSDLLAVDYDWSSTLTIAFHSGGVYEYFHVPPSEYDGLMHASSHGSYFHAHVKKRYSYRKIAG
jgi:KTSC domain